MDIIEFAEKTGVKLSYPQKQFIKRVCESLEKGDEVIIYHPPRMGRTQTINLIESFKEVKDGNNN